MMDKYDALKLDNQVCFPLYAVSKGIVALYQPYLEEIDLTYTQYIAMMVMWEVKETNVKDLGSRLYLDSGTLTPLLKKLESKKLIKRSRDKKDERNLIISLTKEGEELKNKAVEIPFKIANCLHLSEEEATNLYKTLRKLMVNFYE